MSGLYVPGADGGFLHHDAAVLDRRLREGDGLTWTGDPSLELRIGVLTEKATGRVARRYEVWSHTQQGEDVRLGFWRLDEFHQILPDIVLMRAGAEGKVASVADRLDAADKAMEKQKSDEFREAYGPAIEHALNLRRASEGEVFFGQVGKGQDTE